MFALRHCLTIQRLTSSPNRQLAYSDKKRDFASRGTSPSLPRATWCVAFILACVRCVIVFDEKLILVFHLLGYLYLMQLRYKDGQFATRPNSAWRLVFVMALMPWLHKYRQLARLDDFGEEEDEEDYVRNNMRRSSMISSNSRSLFGLSRQSMGNRRGLSAFETNEDDSERTERIRQIQAELECLQNELRKLQDKEEDSC